jgi:DNA-binding transcriptional MerR regulator
MRIGELARRTGVPARRLRYYEEQGLLSSDRSANGYRDYDPQAVEQVTQIKGLIDAGIPTAIIKDILPRLDTSCGIHAIGPADEVINALEQHREQLDARIQCITRNRDAITRYLNTVRASAAVPRPLDHLDPASGKILSIPIGIAENIPAASCRSRQPPRACAL